MKKLLMAAVTLTAMATIPATPASAQAVFNVSGSVTAVCSYTGGTIAFHAVPVLGLLRQKRNRGGLRRPYYASVISLRCGSVSAVPEDVRDEACQRMGTQHGLTILSGGRRAAMAHSSYGTYSAS